MNIINFPYEIHVYMTKFMSTSDSISFALTCTLLYGRLLKTLYDRKRVFNNADVDDLARNGVWDVLRTRSQWNEKSIVLSLKNTHMKEWEEIVHILGYNAESLKAIDSGCYEKLREIREWKSNTFVLLRSLCGTNRSREVVTMISCANRHVREDAMMEALLLGHTWYFDNTWSSVICRRVTGQDQLFEIQKMFPKMYDLVCEADDPPKFFEVVHPSKKVACAVQFAKVKESPILVDMLLQENPDLEDDVCRRLSTYNMNVKFQSKKATLSVMRIMVSDIKGLIKNHTRKEMLEISKGWVAKVIRARSWKYLVFYLSGDKEIFREFVTYFITHKTSFTQFFKLVQNRLDSSDWYNIAKRLSQRKAEQFFMQCRILSVVFDHVVEKEDYQTASKIMKCPVVPIESFLRSAKTGKMARVIFQEKCISLHRLKALYPQCHPEVQEVMMKRIKQWDKFYNP